MRAGKSSEKLRPAELLKVDTEAGEYIDLPILPKSHPIKPNKQYYVEALTEGTAVGIHAVNEYPVLFRLFQRYITRRKLPLKLYCRQVRPDLWILLARKKSDPKPPTMLIGDWREHGRYKWYAEQLEKGEMVKAENELEATKVRRAWMLYTPSERRTGRDARIEFKYGEYRVTVVDSND